MITPPPFSGDWCELLTTRVLLWRLTRRAHALHPFCALHCLCALVPCAVAPCETREREKPGGGAASAHRLSAAVSAPHPHPCHLPSPVIFPLPRRSSQLFLFRRFVGFFSSRWLRMKGSSRDSYFLGAKSRESSPSHRKSLCSSNSLVRSSSVCINHRFS